MPTSTHQPRLTHLRGHVQSFFVKYDGHKLGPYYVRVWQQNGRRRKAYVPADMVEKVRAACDRHRNLCRRQRDQMAKLNNTIGNLNFLNRISKKANLIEELPPPEQDHLRRIQKEGVSAPG